MRPFGLTTLVAAALGLSGAMFAWHPVLADSVEPVPLEAGHGDPVCRSDNIVIASKLPAKSEGMCPEHATEPDETARARAYLIETATPGYTMAAGARTRDRVAASRIRQAVSRRHRRSEGSWAAICRNFLGLPATCIRRGGLRRQIPFAPYLWTGSRRYRDRRTRNAQRPAVARDRLAERRDLPVWATQPVGMESLPADMGENHPRR